MWDEEGRQALYLLRGPVPNPGGMNPIGGGGGKGKGPGKPIGGGMPEVVVPPPTVEEGREDPPLDPSAPPSVPPD
jgi:hypothetical protein